MQAVIHSSVSPFSKVSPLGFWRCAGLRLHALRLVTGFYSALRRLGGATVFRNSRPSASQGFPLSAIGSNIALKPTR
jgi:hypothetical protein